MLEKKKVLYLTTFFMFMSGLKTFATNIPSIDISSNNKCLHFELSINNEKPYKTIKEDNNLNSSTSSMNDKLDNYNKKINKERESMQQPSEDTFSSSEYKKLLSEKMTECREIYSSISDLMNNEYYDKSDIENIEYESEKLNEKLREISNEIYQSDKLPKEYLTLITDVKYIINDMITTAYWWRQSYIVEDEKRFDRESRLMKKQLEKIEYLVDAILENGNDNGVKGTKTYIGKGKDVVFITPDEKSTMYISHEGRGTFVVTSTNGNNKGVITNRAGIYSIEHEISEGKHIFQIDTDGKWEIIVKPSTTKE